jgi:hypothetical protein
MPMKKLIKEIWRLYRVKFTGWWLLDVLDAPEVAVAYAQWEAKELNDGR